MVVSEEAAGVITAALSPVLKRRRSHSHSRATDREGRLLEVVVSSSSRSQAVRKARCS